MHGEGDSTSFEQRDDFYYQRLERLYLDVVAHLTGKWGECIDPSVFKFYVYLTGACEEELTQVQYQGLLKVRDAQMQLAANYGNVEFIETQDIPRCPDLWHPTPSAPGLLDLASRYSDAHLNGIFPPLVSI